MGIWFLIFFLTPLIEIYVLISVGGWVGIWPTIAMVILTAVIGVYLLRQQGLSTLTRGMTRIQQGQLPAREMAEGLFLAVAGALLLTPGFVTDALGFVLLTPVLRYQLVDQVLRRVKVASFQAHHASAEYSASASNHRETDASQTIEGEYERRP